MAPRNPFRIGLGVVSLWPFLPITSRIPSYGRLVAELVADPRVPTSRKAILGLAVLYVASPIDVIPDWIPLVSRLDDVIVLVAALDIFLDGVPRDIMLERMYRLGVDGRELERDMEEMRRFLPEPVREVMRRLPGAIEVGAAFVKRELQARGIIATPNDREADFE